MPPVDDPANAVPDIYRDRFEHCFRDHYAQMLQGIPVPPGFDTSALQSETALAGAAPASVLGCL
jgi:hypothetical protein